MAPHGPLTTRWATRFGRIPGSMDQTNEPKQSRPYRLRDLLPTNETRQRICALPLGNLEIVKKYDYFALSTFRYADVMSGGVFARKAKISAAPLGR
jgi:hypothetical protein